MKIAIPVDENNMDTATCVSFGRVPYFMFYDTESRKTTFLKNTAADVQGGAGIRAAQIIVDANVNALLTVRCGQNAADVLNAAQIKIYKALGASAEENIVAYEEGKLVLITQFHAGFHGHQ